MPRFVPVETIPGNANEGINEYTPTFTKEKTTGTFDGPVGELFSGTSKPDVPDQTNIGDAFGAGAYAGSFTGQQAAALLFQEERARTGTGPDPVYNNFLRNMDTPLSPIDKNFQAPWDSLKGTKYAKYAHLFAGRNTQDEWDTVRAEIDAQEQMQTAMQEHPLVALPAMLATAIPDPIFYAALMNPATAPAALASKSKTIGTIINVAYNAAKIGAVSYGMAKLEQDKSISITDQDAYTAAIVGGTVGAIAGGLKYSGDIKRFTQAVDRQVKGTPPKPIIVPKNTEGRSAGAAEAVFDSAPKVDETAMKAYNGITMTKYLRGATFNTVNSEMSTVRDLGHNVYGHILRTEGAVDDFVPLDAMVKKAQGKAAAEAAMHDEIVTKYASESKITPENEAIVSMARDPDKLNDEVYRVMGRKQINPLYKSNNPLVEELTGLWDKVGMGIGSALKKVHLLPEDLELGYYTTRIFRAKAVRNLSNDEIAAIAAKQYRLTPQRFADEDDAYTQIHDYFRTIRNGGHIDETDELSEALVDGKVLKANAGRGEISGATASNFQKQKSRLVNDEILVDHGLIETDIKAVMHNYSVKTAKLMELRKFLDRHNVKDIPELTNKMKREKEALMDAARAEGKSSKEIEALNTKLDFEIDEGLNLLKEHMGTIYKRTALSPFIDTFKLFSSGLFLANTSLTQVIQDPIQAALRSGADKYMANAIKEMATVGSTVRSMTRSEAQAMGDILDVTMNDTINLLLSGEDMVNKFAATPLEKFNVKARNFFGIVTGVQPVTTGEKLAMHYAITTKMADELKLWKEGSASTDALNKFHDLGIGEKHRDLMLEQIRKHGAKEGDFTNINWEAWDEGLARDKMSAAVQKEVGTAIVTPNVGDQPSIFLGTAWGKLLGTFQSFSGAAASRVVAASIQDKKPGRIMMYMFSMIAAGYMRYAIGEVIMGREPEHDLGTIIGQGILRSGFTSIAANVLLTATRPIYTQDSRNNAETYGGLILGAGFNATYRVYDLVASAADPHVDKYQLAAKATQATPLLNWGYIATHLRKMFVEKSKNDPEAKRNRRAQAKIDRQKARDKANREF